MTNQTLQGVIVKGIGGFYSIRIADGQVFTCRARGIFRKQKITPLVGDTVLFTPNGDEEESWIDEILERKNELLRPPVANVAYLLVVIAPKPKPDLLLVDALLVEARKQGITPVLVINKSDLDRSFCEKARDEYAQSGDRVLITSSKKQQGLAELDTLLQTGICCFAGQSGVGKSSLVSAVTGLQLVTGDISRKTSRGKHTTRHAELMIQGDYQVLDTAGFSLLSPTEPEDPVLLKQYYPEFAPYDAFCRFQPCYHDSEPGCAVLKAMKDGHIPKARVERYHVLLQKEKEAWKQRYE